MSDAQNSGRTAPGRPFQKGDPRINKGGRPKESDMFRAKARKAVDEHVIERWIAEVRDDGPDWMRASELLAAYGYGKPSSAPEDLDAVRDGGGSALAALTRDDLLKIAKGETP